MTDSAVARSACNCNGPKQPDRVAGRTFTEQELELIDEVVGDGVGVSRRQLTFRVCERLDWRRPSGALKDRECRDLLERLERDGRFRLPEKRNGRPRGAHTRTLRTPAGEPAEPLVGTIRELEPLTVEPVHRAADHRLFRELLGRYHYLGYRVPYGAHLRYLVFVGTPERRVVGALQVSSAAWRLAVRDRWIGWDEQARLMSLQQVVNNSRFLVLPWISVRNLASRTLSLLARRLPGDWHDRYAVLPLLVETLVDPRFRGTSYRAANWLDIGVTAGRGRMDREHKRHGRAPKRVLIYPLARNVARRLREGGHS